MTFNFLIYRMIIFSVGTDIIAVLVQALLGNLCHCSFYQPCCFSWCRRTWVFQPFVHSFILIVCISSISLAPHEQTCRSTLLLIFWHFASDFLLRLYTDLKLKGPILFAIVCTVVLVHLVVFFRCAGSPCGFYSKHLDYVLKYFSISV